MKQVTKIFKNNPVLHIAVIFSVLVELILIVLVYNKIGSERILVQFLRMGFQIVIIAFVIVKKSNAALFILLAYHIITAMLIYAKFSGELFAQILIAYHFLIGIILYFHEWIESKIFRKA